MLTGADSLGLPIRYGSWRCFVGGITTLLRMSYRRTRRRKVYLTYIETAL